MPAWAAKSFGRGAPMRLDERLRDRGPGAPVRPGSDARSVLLLVGALALIAAIGGAVVWIDAAMRPPPADPKLANRRATMTDNPAGWVTPDDYPAEALRRGEEGAVGVTMTIDAYGRVSACEVSTSSRSEVLDSTTCDLVKRRARYTPARDAQGVPVTDRRTLRFRWQIRE